MFDVCLNQMLFVKWVQVRRISVRFSFSILYSGNTFFRYRIELNKSLPKICHFFFYFCLASRPLIGGFVKKKKNLLVAMTFNLTHRCVFNQILKFCFGFALSPLLLHFDQIKRMLSKPLRFIVYMIVLITTNDETFFFPFWLNEDIIIQRDSMWCRERTKPE